MSRAEPRTIEDLRRDEAAWAGLVREAHDLINRLRGFDYECWCVHCELARELIAAEADRAKPE